MKIKLKLPRFHSVLPDPNNISQDHIEQTKIDSDAIEKHWYTRFNNIWFGGIGPRWYNRIGAQSILTGLVVILIGVGLWWQFSPTNPYLNANRDRSKLSLTPATGTTTKSTSTQSAAAKKAAATQTPGSQTTTSKAKPTSTAGTTSNPPGVGGPCSAPNPSNPTFAKTSGNHLIATNGQVMVPYGMTVYGLSRQDWQGSDQQDDAQITTAITQWCTNFIRIQIAPAGLLAGDAASNSAYLAEIESEVQLALSYDQNVILTAQTEHFDDQPSANPTQEIINFWQVLAPIYADNPRVWFDVFNEPRLDDPSVDQWDAWQNGDVYQGQTYIGMQTLVNAVRQVAGSNLILVETPSDSASLNDLPGRYITGSNIAYAVHPYGQDKQSQWNTNFVNASQTVPVIVDEWGEYDNGTADGECEPDAFTAVPAFLSYLRANQIGLGGWALIPGSLVTNTTTFTPTQITSSYSCNLSASDNSTITANRLNNGNTPVPDAQGAGQLIQNYFIQYSRN